MENILKSLKRAEDAAEEVEADAGGRAAAIIKKAEDISKANEAEFDRKAKEIGERMLETSKNKARQEIETKNSASTKASAAIDKSAKDNMDTAIGEVVESVLKHIGSAD